MLSHNIIPVCLSLTFPYCHTQLKYNNSETKLLIMQHLAFCEQANILIVCIEHCHSYINGWKYLKDVPLYVGIAWMHASRSAGLQTHKL